MITFEIRGERVGTREKLIAREDGIARWNVRKSDWTKYREELGRLAGEIGDRFSGGVVQLERGIKKAVCRAAVVAIPRRRGGLKGNVWWDRELDDMKKRVVRIKSQLRRDRTCEAVLNEFRGTKREYGRLLRAKMKENWVRFVEEEMKGNEWGKTYKVAVGKCRPREVI